MRYASLDRTVYFKSSFYLIYNTISYPFWLMTYEAKAHTTLALVLSILKREIHVQKIYVKNVYFPILSIFQWQPFSLFFH